MSSEMDRRSFATRVLATPFVLPTAFSEMEIPSLSRRSSTLPNKEVGTNQQEQDQAWNEFQEGYSSYKDTFVTHKGAGDQDQYLRVKMPEEWIDPVNSTTSEGIGYGMLFALFADDKNTFDNLWQYGQSHFVDGLMHWNIGPDNQKLVGEGESEGPASDADIDMASALISASKRWNTYTDSETGSERSYREDALILLENIMDQEVESDTFVIKLSPIWGGSEQTNPDRFDPYAFRSFAAFSGDARWEQVADTSMQIIQHFYAENPHAILLPEWLTANGEALPSDSGEPLHGYDATRYPIRFGKSLLRDNDQAAFDVLKKENEFYEHTIKDPENIVDGYLIDGVPVGEYLVNSFVVGAYMASLTSDNEEYRKRVAEVTKQLSEEDTSYFSQSLFLYSRLVAANKFS